nr:ABC transporter ATP-binding protein [uncultured Cellulosilyticum sp.]
MIKLIKYLKPYIGHIFAIIVLLFSQAMCELALPDYMSKIVNQGISVGDTTYIIKTGGMMLLISLGSAVCAIVVGLFASRIAAKVAMALRRDVFEKVESFSSVEFDKFQSASLITRTTNDITQVQTVLIMMLRMVFYAPIMGVGGIFKALSKNVSMSWIIALAVIILIGIIAVIFSLALPRFKRVQKLIDKLNLVTRENLSGMLVIRAFNTQGFEEARFDETNKTLTGVNLFVNRLMSFLMPAMMLIMNLTTVLIVWIGAKEVGNLNMQVGDMMAFIQYAMQIIMSFLMISMMFIMIPRASVSGDRVAEVLETEVAIRDPKEEKKFNNKVEGIVEFKNVEFSYPGAEDAVLHDISFTAKPGETTAFIGSTGSGKSTLINLIPRFYDVTKGAITIDGIDVRDISQHNLHEQIGYVPQKAVLFSGDIESNLKYGRKEATDLEIEEVIEIAQSKEFILAKPEGIKAPIAQGGSNVSGGQKQRLSIGRALAKKAPICILDDSFSALDFKTDAALRKALKEKMADTTMLVVAQRISSIMHAEQIIVLDGGRIVGKGTHHELLQNCSVYKEIALSQLSREELDNE